MGSKRKIRTRQLQESTGLTMPGVILIADVMKTRLELIFDLSHHRHRCYEGSPDPRDNDGAPGTQVEPWDLFTWEIR